VDQDSRSSLSPTPELDPKNRRGAACFTQGAPRTGLLAEGWL